MFVMVSLTASLLLLLLLGMLMVLEMVVVDSYFAHSKPALLKGGA